MVIAYPAGWLATHVPHHDVLANAHLTVLGIAEKLAATLSR
jgi:hypothetical protein